MKRLNRAQWFVSIVFVTMFVCCIGLPVWANWSALLAAGAALAVVSKKVSA